MEATHNCTTTLVPGFGWPAIRHRLTKSQSSVIRVAALYGSQQDADDAAVIAAIVEHGPMNVGQLFRKRITASRNRSSNSVQRLSNSTPPRLILVQSKVLPNGVTTNLYGLPL